MLIKSTAAFRLTLPAVKGFKKQAVIQPALGATPQVTEVDDKYMAALAGHSIIKAWFGKNGPLSIFTPPTPPAPKKPDAPAKPEESK